MKYQVKISTWVVRIALAAAFLSAVADRLGFWGAPGEPGVAWGDVAHYEAYVGQLNGFLPLALISPVGWLATLAEIIIAIGLLVGWQLRYFSLAAGILLTIFATAMCVAFGIKSPLDYSVFSAAGAAYLLYSTTLYDNAAGWTSQIETATQGPDDPATH
tara:strand:- start:862 stop:1338 length:477 start_codon:yes stop_codon:yes gene_type:complete